MLLKMPILALCLFMLPVYFNTGQNPNLIFQYLARWQQLKMETAELQLVIFLYQTLLI